jgi:hypothetical protein
VLAVYDTALLYHLGHLPARLPGALVAAAVLVAARAAARLPGRDAGPTVSVELRALGWFLSLFFVPALAIRYGLIFGAPVVAALAGLVVAAAAAGHALRPTPVPWRALLPRLAAAITLGGAAAGGGYMAAPGYPEARLLCAAGALCVVAVLAATALDRYLPHDHRAAG